MYRKASSGWEKHIDFVFLDMVCLQVAYCLACLIWQGMFLPLRNPMYRNMIFIFFLSQIFVTLFDDGFKNIMKRDYLAEFKATVRHVLIIVLFATFYLFSTQEAKDYSRGTMFVTAEAYILLTYTVRCCWKNVLRNRRERWERSLVVITSAGMAEEVIGNLQESDYNGIRIMGLALMDEEGALLTGKEVAGIPVVADRSTVTGYVCQEWVDEVLLTLPKEMPFPEEMYDELVAMGITVHLRLLRAMPVAEQKQSVGRLGSYTVLSSSVNMISLRQVIYKRTLDIFGGILGCMATAILTLLIGPLIYMKSPGPIFYSQERVGKNGRTFRLYKFRSMYLDADARKKELMEQNQMKDGMMFKMKDDPRVIGGSHGIGGIIRKFSLDEFPQFWNVLKGDMSLVGTRPPTVEEWEKYDLSHRVRLAAKPGITGMWQVSGRSNITDFDEVVKLDKTYILNWSMGLDFKILFKTVGRVFKGDGAL